MNGGADVGRKGGGMLIAMIVASVGLAAVAQLTLKAGMNSVRASHGIAGADVATLRAVIATPLVWLGLVLFGLSAIVWLGVLSRASLSFAYPFAALSYVIILLVDRFVLAETVPAARWAGVGLIMLGILVIARTSPS